MVLLLTLGPIACGDDETKSGPVDAAVDVAADMPQQVVYPTDGGETSCARATPVSCGDDVSGDNSGGANWIDKYLCTALPNSGPETYYSFTDTETRIVTVDLTVSDPEQDLDLFVLGADCDAAACIDHSTKTRPEDERVRFAAEADREYRIIVDGYVMPVGLGPGSTGAAAFNLSVSCETPSCTPAATVDCDTTELAGNNGLPGSTDSLTTYGCGGDDDGREYVYSFDSPIQGEVTVTLDIANTALDDLDLFILEDTGNACSAVDCVGASLTRFDETVTFDVTFGTTYYIVVDGHDESEGDYLLSVECAGGPPPDGGMDSGVSDGPFPD